MRCKTITLLRLSIMNKRFFNLIRSDYPLGIWRSFFFKTLQITYDQQYQIQTNFSWFEIYLSLLGMCLFTCWLLIDNFPTTQLSYSLYFVLWYGNIRCQGVLVLSRFLTPMLSWQRDCFHPRIYQLQIFSIKFCSLLWTVVFHQCSPRPHA